MIFVRKGQVLRGGDTRTGRRKRKYAFSLVVFLFLFAGSSCKVILISCFPILFLYVFLRPLPSIIDFWFGLWFVILKSQVFMVPQYY